MVMHKRQVLVEPLFAEGKMWHGLRRFRLRRLERVNIEALLIASAQNLKRLLRWRARGLKPAPAMAVFQPLTEEKPSLCVQMALRIEAARPQCRSRPRALGPMPAL